MDGRTGLTSSNPPAQRIILLVGIARSTQQKKKTDLLFGLLINPLPDGSFHNGTVYPDGARIASLKVDGDTCDRVKEWR